MKPHQLLSPVARLLCYNHNGFIVGGAVDYLSGNSSLKPKDIDIIINPIKFMSVMMEIRTLVGENIKLNSFGGFKIEDEIFTLDVWPDTLENLILNNTQCKFFIPQERKIIESRQL